jgi:DNA-binding MarR family transcriptional regulator
LPAHGKLIREPLFETGLRSGPVVGVTMKKAYTAKQGQYLAFIYYYTRIHGRAPTEAEMQQYFQVSPPSVHQMVLALVARGLIERTPGRARSIRLLIPHEELPDLA